MGIDKKIITQILKIILSFKDAERIVLFGSRAADNFRDTSDIDVAIFGRGWSDKDINLVKHSLETEIKTPLKFDVLNFYAITKGKLKENILKDGRVIYESRKN